ncbi:hypothetical protein EYZ11_011898 [Aspergillus tanneri]|uniref:Uncharacterized protein n=1 Tax=Aspergillus tanneri TaxID=1220188 RepID=A0A4S3J1L5_9EURO|nr:uncharacterized protein ATNIH1004_010258 [Aspergillus tanneri]KAA8643489.1 hypothetical protein ATNIH1004_010258 [Aspergillus tanneri]THC88653.1 hypothetical protein EYZ11_011898 [Aspergillus tanneri]
MQNLDITKDYGTPNALYFNYITQVPPDSVDDLNELHRQIQDMYAYELGQTEDEIQKQMDQGTLPKDDSVDSRIQRTVYRGRLIDNLRNEEKWLNVHEEKPSEPKKLKADKNDVISTILRELLSHYSKHPEPFSVLLRLLRNTIAVVPGEQKYWYTHAVLRYDRNKDEVIPELHRVAFKIDRQDISGDTVEITISYANSRLEMDVDKWLNERRNLHHIIKSGTSVREKMALNFSLRGEEI